MLDHFFSLFFPKDSESLKIFDIRLQEVGIKRPFNGTSKVKKKVREKNFFLRGDFRQFLNKNVHIWNHFLPLLFPKDSESLKILDIRLRHSVLRYAILSGTTNEQFLLRLYYISTTLLGFRLVVRWYNGQIVFRSQFETFPIHFVCSTHLTQCTGVTWSYLELPVVTQAACLQTCGPQQELWSSAV